MEKTLHCRKPKRVLRLPDLEYAKTAALNILGSPDSQRWCRLVVSNERDSFGDP
jgi:hypothetical protein